MIIAVSFFAINFDSADAVLKNHAVVFDDVRNDDVFGSKVQITVPDMFILDEECNLNQVAVATQWIQIRSYYWIESGITAGKITTSTACYNEPIFYYGQAVKKVGAPNNRDYTDYKVKDATVGNLVNFEISDTNKDGYWSVWIDSYLPVANLLIPNSHNARSVEYGIESEIIPSNKYSNIPNTHFNNFQKYDNGVWVNSDVDYRNIPNSEYHKQRCTDSQHFVAGNVLSIDCNRSTVVNTSPSLATPILRDSGTFEKTITLTATDPDKDYVHFYLDKVPTKARIYVNGVQITDIRDPIPSNGKSTTFVYDSYSGASDTLVITATDERTGHSVTKTIDFFPVSQTAPTLSSISNISINEGQSKTITARATDSNGDTISYSLSNSPSWVTISGSTITINAPSELSRSSYSVTVKATDNDGYDTESFRIYINEINQAPILSSVQSKSIKETSTLSFTISGTDSDVPKQSLRYSTSNTPTGASINSSTGLFTWTPSITQSGVYSVTFTVTDNGSPAKYDSETVRITVINKSSGGGGGNPIPQTAPALSSISDVTINEGQSKTFSVSASDRNGDRISYSLSSAPSWVTISGKTVTINAPSELSRSSYSVTVRATDNDGYDSESFTINITEVNQAPTLSSIGNKSIKETSTLSFTISGTDSDRPANNLRYSISNAPTGASINYSTGAFTWTPTNSQAGTYSVTFTVTDNGSPTKSDSQSVTITVLDKPAPVTDTTKSTLTITSPVNGATITSDSVTVSGTASASSGISFISVFENTAAQKHFKGTSFSHTFTGLSTGSHTFTVYVFDIHYNHIAKSVTVTVAPAVAPTVVPIPQTDTTLFSDEFNSGVGDWEKYSKTGVYSGITAFERYNISTDSTMGKPAPSIKISGDGFVSQSGIQKTIDVSSVNDRPLYLSFDYRAVSGYISSSVTNANLGIYDGTTGEQLYHKSLIAGGTLDSGWNNYQKEISNVILNHDTITIKLYMHDSWSTNWNQQNWYDNITLSTVQPGQTPQGQSFYDGYKQPQMTIPQNMTSVDIEPTSHFECENMSIYHDYTNDIPVNDSYNCSTAPFYSEDLESADSIILYEPKDITQYTILSEFQCVPVTLTDVDNYNVIFACDVSGYQYTVEFVDSGDMIKLPLTLYHTTPDRVGIDVYEFVQ